MRRRAVFCLSAWLLFLPFIAVAQNAGAQSAGEEQQEIQTAPVILDGDALFTVRGVTSFPAAKRAEQIAERIRALAKDRSFNAQTLRLSEVPSGTQILAGDKVVVTVFNDDARIENVDRQVLAQAFLVRVKEAIEQFRTDRQPRILVRHSIYALFVVLVIPVITFGEMGLVRRLRVALERRYKDRIQGVGIQSLQLVHAQHVWNFVVGLVVFIGVVIYIAFLYVALFYVFSLFPWTRGISRNLSAMLLNPLSTIASAVVAVIPNLIFLAILGLVVYYLLKVVRVFFDAIETETVTITNFDPGWAKPTYRLARGLVVAFALVVAFPYIPGSDTQAFKGLSLFVGLIFSFGSTSLIGNLISGYSLAYRRTFKQGDRVKIGEHVGFVQESRLMVTYLQTTKNEMIAVPNSEIINSSVINYSSLAQKHGLIIHTTVGIGYETPWRQVEAMLIEAAIKTPGLLRDPKPFVLQKELGDFAVTYEINAYSESARSLERLYTDLHANILDIFNEFGVQIMTPAYEADPKDAKLVAKENWYLAPARPDQASAAAAKQGYTD